jgi:hypothetical protein
VTADPLLGPLLRRSGGYALAQIGPATENDYRLLVGALVRVRLRRAIEGTHRLPTTCRDSRGFPVSLRPARFALHRVTRLGAVVSFAERRVVEVVETGGERRLLSGRTTSLPGVCAAPPSRRGR